MTLYSRKPREYFIHVKLPCFPRLMLLWKLVGRISCSKRSTFSKGCALFLMHRLQTRPRKRGRFLTISSGTRLPRSPLIEDLGVVFGGAHEGRKPPRYRDTLSSTIATIALTPESFRILQPELYDSHPPPPAQPGPSPKRPLPRRTQPSVVRLLLDLVTFTFTLPRVTLSVRRHGRRRSTSCPNSLWRISLLAWSYILA